MEIEKTEENFRKIRQEIRNTDMRKSENIDEWKRIMMDTYQLPKRLTYIIENQAISAMKRIFGNKNSLKFETGLALCNAGLGSKFVALGYDIMKESCLNLNERDTAWKLKTLESYARRFLLV